jgi:ribose transport system substrate-binding protein
MKSSKTKNLGVNEMKITKIFSLLSVMLVVSLAAVACQPAAEAPVAEEPAAEVPAAEEPEAKSYVFGLVTKALNNPFWELMHEGALAVAAENNVEIIYLAPTQANNLEEQTRLVDDLITRKVDGIVLVPVDSEGMVPAIERANAAGIPVALANTRANGGEFITFSAVENYDAMTQVAEYVVEQLGGSGKVVIIEGTAGAQTAIDRLAAINDVLAKNPGIEILASQTAEFQRAKALEVMENLLQTHPEIDAVLACNDEEALGAIEALDAAGRLEGTIVSGFDGNSDALKALTAGRMTVTMFQNAPAQAGDAVQALLDYLAGKPVEVRIRTGAVLIDSTNVADFAQYIQQ